jgi:hypothetical protein
MFYVLLRYVNKCNKDLQEVSRGFMIKNFASALPARSKRKARFGLVHAKRVSGSAKALTTNDLLPTRAIFALTTNKGDLCAYYDRLCKAATI